MNAVIRQVCRNVQRWRDPQMALRWTAAGMLEAAKSFRRLEACKQLSILEAALEKHRCPKTGAPVDPMAEAAKPCNPQRRPSHFSTSGGTFPDRHLAADTSVSDVRDQKSETVPAARAVSADTEQEISIQMAGCEAAGDTEVGNACGGTAFRQRLSRPAAEEDHGRDANAPAIASGPGAAAVGMPANSRCVLGGAATSPDTTDNRHVSPAGARSVDVEIRSLGSVTLAVSG